MNEVMTKAANTSVAALQHLRQGLQNVRASLPSQGGETLLKYSKGDWLIGVEQIEVEPGSQWAINPLSLYHGWVSWDSESRTLEGEVMVPMTEAQPPKGSLPHTGFPWEEQLSLQFKCLTGEDEGEQLKFITSSKGGVATLRDLIKTIMRQLDTDPDNPCPVVLLKSSHYPHKKWGKVYTPVLEIVGWMSMDGVLAPNEGVNNSEPEAQEGVAKTATVGQDEVSRPGPVAEDVGASSEASTSTEGNRRRRRRA